MYSLADKLKASFLNENSPLRLSRMRKVKFKMNEQLKGAKFTENLG